MYIYIYIYTIYGNSKLSIVSCILTLKVGSVLCNLDLQMTFSSPLTIDLTRLTFWEVNLISGGTEGKSLSGNWIMATGVRNKSMFQRFLMGDGT